MLSGRFVPFLCIFRENLDIGLLRKHLIHAFHTGDVCRVVGEAFNLNDVVFHAESINKTLGAGLGSFFLIESNFIADSEQPACVAFRFFRHVTSLPNTCEHFKARPHPVVQLDGTIGACHLVAQVSLPSSA